MGFMNDHRNNKTPGNFQQSQRCELCNTPVYGSPRRDARCNGVFKGKGKVLCNKCFGVLGKMPAEQALQALANAHEMYSEK